MLPKWPDEVVLKIREQYARGATLAALVLHTGIPYPTVYKIVNNLTRKDIQPVTKPLTQQEVIDFLIAKAKDAVAETAKYKQDNYDLQCKLDEANAALELADQEIKKLQTELAPFKAAAPLSEQNKADLALLGMPGLAN